MGDAYRQGLDQNPANYAALTPLTFLQRTAAVHPKRISIIHGHLRYTWEETYKRSRQLASALRTRGVGHNDTVAVVAPNVPCLYEAHFGIPMAGAVLNAVNIRMDAPMLSFLFKHGKAKVVISDRQFLPLVQASLKILAEELKQPQPLLVVAHDPLDTTEHTHLSLPQAPIDYETFLQEGDPEYQWEWPKDEWDAISLNYTSGTTSNPKGVVYHHRGAYLNAVSEALVWGMPQHAVYLWTLPMFHCNGWCFPWTMAAMAGTNVCLRQISGPAIFHAIGEYGVTHLSGAPVVLGMVIGTAPEAQRALPHPIHVMTAGAAPPPPILTAMEQMGFKVLHVYGLTETYGPATVCAWKAEWDELPVDQKARLHARQGVRYPSLEGLEVMDPATMQAVRADGQTIGEVMLRGNNVMKGYLANERATEEAFAGGWFHSGDLAVKHPDGYVEIKDRSKDIIISGGENISSIQVESILYKHPAVLEAAAVAMPDEKWGERPCVFIDLKQTAQGTTELEIIEWCKAEMPKFMVPAQVVFGPLPKTATGKIQKYLLREKVRKGRMIAPRSRI